MQAETIELSDDDDDVVPRASVASSSLGPLRCNANPVLASGSRDAAIEILSDDEEPSEAPAKPVANGSADQPLMIDDDPGERAARLLRKQTAACKLCEADRLDKAYTLGECKHSFCRACLVEYVERKLRRFLASEVACPVCSTSMTVGDVQAMSNSAKASRPREAPPPPSLPPGLPPHLAAALGIGLNDVVDGVAASSKRPRVDKPVSHASHRAGGTAAATKRLMRELQAIQKADTAADGFAVSLPDDTDL